MIAAEAAAESPLWGEALRSEPERELEAVFSPLAPTSATPSGSRRSTRATSSTTGARGSSRRPTATPRSCSATTSTRTGSSASRDHDEVEAVADLAELISLCARLQADGAPGDGEAWAATAAWLGAGRDRRGAGPRAAPDVERALSLHARARVG